jgi:hypothetical protein
MQKAGKCLFMVPLTKFSMSQIMYLFIINGLFNDVVSRSRYLYSVELLVC